MSRLQPMHGSEYLRSAFAQIEKDMRRGDAWKVLELALEDIAAAARDAAPTSARIYAGIALKMAAYLQECPDTLRSDELLCRLKFDAGKMRHVYEGIVANCNGAYTITERVNMCFAVVQLDLLIARLEQHTDTA